MRISNAFGQYDLLCKLCLPPQAIHLNRLNNSTIIKVIKKKKKEHSHALFFFFFFPNIFSHMINKLAQQPKFGRPLHPPCFHLTHPGVEFLTVHLRGYNHFHKISHDRTLGRSATVQRQHARHCVRNAVAHLC